jgi:hypothetical protein
MHDDASARHAELSAGALAGDLTAAEEAELAALDAARPDAEAERAELAALVARLEGVEAWEDAQPSDELASRIAAIDDDDAIAPPAPASLDARRRRRGTLLPLIAGAAACLAVGVGIGAAAFGVRDVEAVQGPPGTPGAVEEVDFVGAPAAVAIDGALVAHTWGTETVLTIDGLETGATFTVVVVDEDGAEHVSGAMLGSDVAIDCRLNAAVLREDVASVEIRTAEGEQIAHADVDDV